MSFEIVYTENFERELKKLAKKYRSIKADLAHLLDEIEQDPKQGVSLGKDCYKMKMAISAKGKGKSAGARVITNVYIKGNIVYLLSVFDKSEKENITDKELEALLKFLNE
jgi:mRNA-degrading endonuclease RelE of RelBE toxin-antitoxin system